MSKILRHTILTENAYKSTNPLNQAIVSNRTVYLSGCVGIDKVTLKLVPGGIVPETQKALQNANAVLEAADSSIEKVIKANVYLADMGDFAKFNDEYQKVFVKDFPARTCVQMAKLPLNGRVEIEIIALTGDVETVTN